MKLVGCYFRLKYQWNKIFAVEKLMNQLSEGLDPSFAATEPFRCNVRSHLSLCVGFYVDIIRGTLQSDY
jgi:hypothetical protein